MVKLRLTRTGRKGHASYRVIAVDSRRPRDSMALEFLGYYLPHEKTIELNADRINYWLSVGAQPSDTVRYLMVRQGLATKEAKPKKFKAAPGKKSAERSARKQVQPE